MSNCGSVNSLEDKLTTQCFSVYQALPFFVHGCGAISYQTSFLSSFSLHHFLVYCHVKMSFLVCGMQDEMEVCLEGQIMLNFANSSNKSWRNNVVISEMPPPYLRDTQVLSPLLFGNPLYFSFQFTKKFFKHIPMSLQALLGQGHIPMPTQTPLGQGHHPQQVHVYNMYLYMYMYTYTVIACNRPFSITYVRWAKVHTNGDIMSSSCRLS